MAKAGDKPRAKKDCADGGEDGLIRAMTHPLRREALRVLIASRTPISPQEIEDKLGLTEERKEKLSSVSYHVRQLARHGAAALLRKEQVRGATKHLYVSKVGDIAWVRQLLRRTKKADEATLWPDGRN
jgi:polysaccharide pyruvyl transferase WcaK-like protein